MKRKMRQILHNIRIFHIQRMAKLVRYILFTIGGVFAVAFILRLFGVGGFVHWETYQMVIVSFCSLLTATFLYITAPSKKTDPY